MIERYSRPQMKNVWSDENKFNKWLEVEIAVCESWAELGVIPREEVPKIKMARINLKRMEEILKETHHDVTAFLGSVATSLGNESRFIHLGLTSSDVIDTALSMQLVEAIEILNQDILLWLSKTLAFYFLAVPWLVALRYLLRYHHTKIYQMIPLDLYPFVLLVFSLMNSTYSFQQKRAPDTAAIDFQFFFAKI